MPYYIQINDKDPKKLSHQYVWHKHIKEGTERIVLGISRGILGVEVDIADSMLQALGGHTHQFASLTQCPNLKSLTISSMTLRPQEIERLCDALHTLDIKELTLKACSLGDEGIALISQRLLTTNHSLESVNFDFNGISGKGLYVLFRAMYENHSCKITKISLNGNKIPEHSSSRFFDSEEYGIIEFFEQLQLHNKKPQVGIKITDVSVKQKMMPLSSKGVQELSKLVELNQFLTSVEYLTNAKDAATLKAIAGIDKSCETHIAFYKIACEARAACIVELASADLENEHSTPLMTTTGETNTDEATQN